jgi:hypothetical protein
VAEFTSRKREGSLPFRAALSGWQLWVKNPKTSKQAILGRYLPKSSRTFAPQHPAILRSKDADASPESGSSRDVGRPIRPHVRAYHKSTLTLKTAVLESCVEDPTDYPRRSVGWSGAASVPSSKMPRCSGRRRARLRRRSSGHCRGRRPAGPPILRWRRPPMKRQTRAMVRWSRQRGRISS